VPYFAVLLVPSIVFFLEFVAFIFYGNRYPFSWGVAFFFAIAAVIVVVDESYASLAGSVGTSGAKVVTISSILALAVLISLDVVLIPLIGISGAALTLIFANLAPAVYLYSMRRILGGGRKKRFERSARAKRTASSDSDPICHIDLTGPCSLADAKNVAAPRLRHTIGALVVKKNRNLSSRYPPMLARG